MPQLIRAGLAAVILGVVGGCAPSDPPGKDANSGKKYTAADANAAQPKRKGSDSGE